MKKNFIKWIGHLYKVISSPFSIVVIFLLLVAWFIIGAFMHFNDKWFFALEAFSISVTLLMTFVIEHTQRVDTKALHEKIDELIKKNPQADNEKIGVEKRYKGEK